MSAWYMFYPYYALILLIQYGGVLKTRRHARIFGNCFDQNFDQGFDQGW